MRRGKEVPSSTPGGDRDPGGPWDNSIEDAFDLLLAEPPAAGAGPARHITAEQIRWERCSYCGQPAQSSIFELARRVRVLLCDACQPGAERSSALPTSPG